jgi:hypothetical protein
MGSSWKAYFRDERRALPFLSETRRGWMRNACAYRKVDAPCIPMLIFTNRAPVAQLDRASGYEPEGREFESPRARHSSVFALLWTKLRDTL